MLMNNLDPDVAERPEELVVYGGIGRAARNWECFEAIVAALRTLEEDETLLVQSGKPGGVFRTHGEAPRVLIANSNIVARWATLDHFTELDTAVRERAAFTCIIGNDFRWNAEHQIQLREYGSDRLIGCELAPSARYDLAAAGLGCHGEHVADVTGLDAALARALESGRPACLNVEIDGAAAPVFLPGAVSGGH